ncbi:serine hydrolase [Streptomyces sp. NPDC058657]|uniref:serine hydrolase n=1 Tax=unclassified Streptomyces TaxID=2593676 RepID=UPI0036575DC2
MTPRTAATLALAAGLLLAGLAPPAPYAGAVTAAAPPGAAAALSPVCTSRKAGLAARLRRDLTAALRDRPGSVALVAHEHSSRTSCTLRSRRSYDAASVIKVTVLAALMWDAQRSGRALTARERSLATAMITRSANAATGTLWRQLGNRRINRFLTAAGLSRTTLGWGRLWGLSQVDAAEQSQLLSLLTRPNKVLTASSRAYILDRMAHVVPAQRWGTPVGAPVTMRVHVKNGWLPRAEGGWRVHSLGVFTRRGHDYTIAVLTQGNATLRQGVRTVQAVSRAVHHGLNLPATGRPRTPEPPTGLVTPPAVPEEVVPPTPEDPHPEEPTRADPHPEEPTYADPYPEEPTSADPHPEEPTHADPQPEDPAAPASAPAP